MNALIIYFVKVNIAIALFYLLYRLFFVGDTLLKTRRVYLLLSVFLSFLYPFFSIQNLIYKNEPIKSVFSEFIILQEIIVVPDARIVSISFENIMIALYILVSVILLIRMLVQLYSIIKIRIKGQKSILFGTEVIALDTEIPPFSFFGSIYINPHLHTDDEKQQILLHEITHVRQMHSFDVIIAELICLLFWLNPVAWLLKKEVRQNLEYLADNKVIESGVDSRKYQYHLLQLSYQCPEYNLTNKFNILPLKKRIIMMNKKKSSNVAAFKYLLVAPLVLALIIFSNAQTFASAIKQVSIQPEVLKIENDSKQQTNEEILALPDEKTSNKKETTSNEQKENKQALDEVVVVGYNPQDIKKESTPKEQSINENSTPQSTNKNEDTLIFQVVEKMPQYPGGDQALFKFLSENVKYPVEAQKKGIQGRVICQFVVNRDGSIVDVEVVRYVNSYLDAEAVRVIKAMPVWTPGEQKGKKVRVKYTLPINFRLQ